MATIYDSNKRFMPAYGPDYPTPHWALQLQLVDDGRDISRLVDVTGRELRTGYSSAAGKHFICDALAGTILDYFTQDEIDEICSAGTEHVLDAIAGTTYTIINW